VHIFHPCVIPLLIDGAHSFCKGNSGPTGDSPFTHDKLSVQYFDVSAAQDRKLEDLVHTAVHELWKPAQSELTLATSGMRYLKAPPTSITLFGSSDPCYVEAYI
jgi:hypothetical protein